MFAHSGFVFRRPAPPRPAELIANANANAIAGALVPFEKGIRKLAKNIGIEKLSFLRTLSWDFTKPQLPVGATLAQALELLHNAAEKTGL